MVNSDIRKQLHLSFEDAQALYSSYSTFQSKEKLKNSLLDILGHLNYETLNFEDSRELINKIILKYYPNEISIKSSFINQVLFKTNSHVTIFELPTGSMFLASTNPSTAELNFPSTPFPLLGFHG